IAINPYYSYPAKLPSLLAKIGLHVLEQYKANIHERQSWLYDIFQVVEKIEDMAGAYNDTGCDIIP
ncbi:pyridoxal-5'-phosphate-dependent protein, partial [Phocaeicola vulgatus]|nr:pyridoxal-5'-phosphate-dependent protein [Phocaeicola vulgatus]